jgi:hypothetical protein
MVSLKFTVSGVIDEASTLAPNCTNSDAEGEYAVSPSAGVVVSGKFTHTDVLSLARHPPGLVTDTV